MSIGRRMASCIEGPAVGKGRRHSGSARVDFAVAKVVEDMEHREANRMDPLVLIDNR